MSDDVKDFAYYAAKVEEQLQFSMGRDLEGLKTLISEEAKTRHIMRADVLARLACGAPKALTRQPVSCDEAHPQYDTYHPEGH